MINELTINFSGVNAVCLSITEPIKYNFTLFWIKYRKLSDSSTCLQNIIQFNRDLKNTVPKIVTQTTKETF